MLLIMLDHFDIPLIVRKSDGEASNLSLCPSLKIMYFSHKVDMVMIALTWRPFIIDWKISTGNVTNFVTRTFLVFITHWYLWSWRNVSSRNSETPPINGGLWRFHCIFVIWTTWKHENMNPISRRFAHVLCVPCRDWLIYITDSGQGTHFQKVFDAARAAGWVGQQRLDFIGNNLCHKIQCRNLVLFSW
jgi:hypothetical protein